MLVGKRQKAKREQRTGKSRPNETQERNGTAHGGDHHNQCLLGSFYNINAVVAVAVLQISVVFTVRQVSCGS